MIYGFKDEKSLKVASKKLVRAGVFNDVTIFDSDGSSYLIVDVKELGWATPFFGYSLSKAGQSIKIEFELKPMGKFSLDELKKQLLERIKASTYFKGTFDLNEVENYIIKSNTIRELLSFFS